MTLLTKRVTEYAPKFIGLRVCSHKIILKYELTFLLTTLFGFKFEAIIKWSSFQKNSTNLLRNFFITLSPGRYPIFYHT
jgi:hypothetical protein